MSQLAPLRTRLNEATSVVNETMDAYSDARRMFEAVKGGQDVDLTTVGRSLHIGNITVPMPSVTDRQQLLQELAAAANFLASQVSVAWGEAFEAASAGVGVCQAASEREATKQQAAPAPQHAEVPVPPQPQPLQQQPAVMAEQRITTPPPASRPVTLQPAVPGQVVQGLPQQVRVSPIAVQ